MRAHHRAGALAVKVKVADEEALACFPDMLRVVRKHCTGQPVLRVIRQLERVLEVLGLRYREHGAENLLLENPRVGFHVGDDRGLDEVSLTWRRTAASHRFPFFRSD